MADTGDEGTRGPTPTDRFTAMLFLSAVAIAIACGILGLKLLRIARDNDSAGVAAVNSRNVAALSPWTTGGGQEAEFGSPRFEAVNA